MRYSGTIPLGCEFVGSLFAELIDKVVDLLVRSQSYIMTALDIVKSIFGSGAQPFDLGLVFLLALFEESESFDVPLRWRR